MEQIQEALLVRQAQSDDEQALVQLYQHYVAPIYRYAYSHTGNKHVSEDITSEVFLKMVRQLPGFRGRSSFKTWLYQITKRTIADYWRQHYQTPTTPFEHVREIELLEKNNTTDIEEELFIKEQCIQSILLQLPENYRQVLELRFMKNYTLQETADALRITLANVKVIQHRALKKASELSPTL